ncbi:MAG: hypothetical protein WC848_06420 [Parcubacteria group bacterium]|jgi:uncharacterized repeat protein (TIGR01451 family)
MQKISDKILNNALVLLVILNLASYQVVLPIAISRADDTDSGTTTEVKAEESSSDSDSGADKEDEKIEEEKKAEVDEKEDATTEEKKSDLKVAEPEVKPVPEVDLVTTGAGSADADEPLVVSDDAVSAVIQSDTAAEVEAENTCACQKDPEENNDEEKTCSSDCACGQPADCQSAVVQTNVAQEVINTTEAVAVTGENTIAGVVAGMNSTEVVEQNSDQVQDADTDNNADRNTNKDNSEPEASEEKQAQIITGDATAGAVAVNEINTNIYTDNGVQYQQNITGDFTGDINLIETFDSVLDSAQKLNEENQKALEKVTVTNVNVAEKVENTVLANANSGDNLVEALDSAAEIVTGSAQALAGAVNYINTNIVGNNWLFAQINILGNWTGDLIVPGEGLFELPSAGMVFENITNINLAKSITNFLSSDANSGDNSVTSATGDVMVATGDATATSNGTTLVNTNIANNNWFYLLINNAGNWTGQVFNWNNGNASLAYEYNFGSQMGADAPVTKSVSVNNYNSAEEVSNTVVARANTGENSISEVVGDATIATGDAVARASAFNFINTNIVGNNWFMAVVNNAGTWNGDLVFGYPDLAVDLSADKNTLEPGQSLTYAVKYKNSGQAKCGNVELMLSLPDNFFYQSDSLGAARKNGNDYFWSAPGLKAGEEKTFSVTVLLDPNTGANVASLESVAGVKTDTQEVALANNYASEKTDLIFLADSSVMIQNGLPEKNGKLSVTRQEEATVAVGSISGHSIFVKNSGKDTLYNLEVKEAIKNPSGETMVEYVWPIEKLKKGQTATIQYQIFVDPAMALGDYKYVASAVAIDYYGRQVESKKASKTVAFIGGAPGQTNAYASDENGLISPEAVLAPEEVNTIPEVLGTATEANKIAWQWFLVLMLVPLAFYAQRKEIYRWETIQKFSRQMGSFLSSFL